MEKKEQTWCASSNLQTKQPGEELVDIAGSWGIGINVVITKPFYYSQGPIRTIISAGNQIDNTKGAR
jgi:hypothetical protein